MIKTDVTRVTYDCGRDLLGRACVEGVGGGRRELYGIEHPLVNEMNT